MLSIAFQFTAKLILALSIAFLIIHRKELEVPRSKLARAFLAISPFIAASTYFILDFFRYFDALHIDYFSSQKLSLIFYSYVSLKAIYLVFFSLFYVWVTYLYLEYYQKEKERTILFLSISSVVSAFLILSAATFVPLDRLKTVYFEGVKVSLIVVFLSSIAPFFALFNNIEETLETTKKSHKKEIQQEVKV